MNDMSTSSVETSVARRGRGRRPAESVRREVLEAAAELLFTNGTAAITFDRVAASAGASKTTLYKWWLSPGALAAEAYFDRVESDLDFIDTGNIVDDLRDQLHAFVKLMSVGAAGRVVRELIGEAQSDPALREAFTKAYSHPRRDEAVEALEKAKTRGQIREGLDTSLLVDQLWGACYHRILVLDQTIDNALVDALLQNAFLGAQPR